MTWPLVIPVAGVTVTMAAGGAAFGSNPSAWRAKTVPFRLAATSSQVPSAVAQSTGPVDPAMMRCMAAVVLIAPPASGTTPCMLRELQL